MLLCKLCPLSDSLIYCRLWTICVMLFVVSSKIIFIKNKQLNLISKLNQNICNWLLLACMFYLGWGNEQVRFGWHEPRRESEMWLGVEVHPRCQKSTPSFDICDQSRFDESSGGGAWPSRFSLAYGIQWQSKPHPLFITIEHIRIYAEYSSWKKSDWSTFTLLSPMENQHRCRIVIRS